MLKELLFNPLPTAGGALEKKISDSSTSKSRAKSEGLVMAEGGCVDVESLQELFKSGWDAQKKADSDDFNSTSDEDKELVLKGIRCLERATQLASQLSLFSGNEGIEDLATADLKWEFISFSDKRVN